jgi:hypothetical protein
MKKALSRATFTAGTVALVAVMVGVASGAKLSTKSATATLPGDATTHSVTVKCPKGSKATGGGGQLSDDLNDFWQGSYPAGKRGWTADGYRNVLGNAEFTVFARCLKKAKLSTQSATTAVPDDGQAHSATAKCPKGTKVSGGGVQLSAPDITEPGGSYPSGKREWTGVGRPAGGPGELIVTARCLKGAKLVRKSRSFDMPDDGNTHEVTAKCPKRSKATGGGTQLSDPVIDYVQGSYPTGKRVWTAAGYDGGTVTAHILCLKKPKKK